MSESQSRVKLKETLDDNTTVGAEKVQTGQTIGNRRTDDTTIITPMNLHKIEVVTPIATIDAIDYLTTLTLTDFFSRNGGTGFIQSIDVIIRQAGTPEFVFHFFSTLPTVTSPQGSLLDIAESSLDTYQGTLAFRLGAWTIFTSKAGGSMEQMGKPVKAASGSRDYFVVVQQATQLAYTRVDALRFGFNLVEG